MAELITAISTNWATITAALTALVLALIGVASIYVKLTKDPSDDIKLDKFKKWISKYIALN